VGVVLEEVQVVVAVRTTEQRVHTHRARAGDASGELHPPAHVGGAERARGQKKLDARHDENDNGENGPTSAELRKRRPPGANPSLWARRRVRRDIAPLHTVKRSVTVPLGRSSIARSPPDQPTPMTAAWFRRRLPSQPEWSTARIIGTVYPQVRAISSSGPLRNHDRIRERQLRRRVGSRQAEQFLAMLIVHRLSYDARLVPHILRHTAA
jgi:hypothetical protein